MAGEQISARRTQTRGRLLDAATVLFAERGVLAASVEEICERAGFTRGAFYSNFSSREELCLAWYRRCCEERLALAQSSIDELRPSHLQDPHQVISRGARSFIAAQDADPVKILAAVEVRLFAARNDAMRADYQELTHHTRQLFTDLVSDALAGFGWSWAVDPVIGIGLLEAVYEQNIIEAVLAGRDLETVIAPMLTALLTSMISQG